MNYHLDFTKPLHIFFNEDNSEDREDTEGKKIDNFSQLIEKFSGLQKLVLEYDLEKFLLLLQVFDSNLDIYVWIHPNIKRSMKDSEHSYPALIIAGTLKCDHPEIKFNLISRHPAGAPQDITALYRVYPITVLNKLEENQITSQNVGELRQLKSKNSTATEIPASNSRVDFAIITALYSDEFTSLIKVFNLENDSTLKIGGKSVYSGRLDNFPDKKIIATYQTHSGRTDATTIVTEIIKEFNPRYIFMTGVCGGNANTNFGDVIVAKFVFTFDKGKISDEGFFRELELVKINEDTIRRIIERQDEVLREVKTQLISAKDLPESFSQFNYQKLNVFIEPVACSSMVIDKKNYFNEVIKTIERKATAVEMESYGFARAAESTNSGKTIGIIIKSVMDNTVQKDDMAKQYASYTSALFLKKILDMGVIL